MKVLYDHIERIEDELEGAKSYAEKYISCKAIGNMSSANMYKEMANDELKHSMYMYELANKDMEQIGRIYSLPVQEQEAWDLLNKKYAEHHAMIRQMLNL